MASRTAFPNDLGLEVSKDSNAKFGEGAVELEDGDFLQLFWALEGNGPMVIILHGLEGDHTSNTVKAMFG